MPLTDTITVTADRTRAEEILGGYLAARGADPDVDDAVFTIMTEGWAQHLLDCVRGRLELQGYKASATVSVERHAVVTRFRIGGVKGRVLIYSTGTVGFDMKHASPLMHGFVAVGFDPDTRKSAADAVMAGIDRWLAKEAS